MSYDFSEMYGQADKEGREAAERVAVQPMVVQEVGLDDKPYPGSRSYYVADGVCGFAWVKVYGNCAFSRWGKKMGYFEKASYGGGVELWVSDYGQCMQKKEAYAQAFAKCLQAYGLRAYAGSRMD